MLYDFFKCNQHLAHAEIKETIDTLNVKFSSVSKVTPDFIIKLVDELKTISQRDRFELFLVVSGNDERITNTSKQSLDMLLKHINDNDLFDEFEIELTIRKEIAASTLSI